MEKWGVLWDGTLNFEAEKRYVYDHDSKAMYNDNHHYNARF